MTDHLFLKGDFFYLTSKKIYVESKMPEVGEFWLCGDKLVVYITDVCPRFDSVYFIEVSPQMNTSSWSLSNWRGRFTFLSLGVHHEQA